MDLLFKCSPFPNLKNKKWCTKVCWARWKQWRLQVKLYTYGQIIWSAVWMVLQMEVFKFQFKRTAVAGFQPPVALGAVVVGHRVVGRCEHAGGSGEIASTTYGRETWDDTHPFLSGKTATSCLYQTGATVTPL